MLLLRVIPAAGEPFQRQVRVGSTVIGRSRTADLPVSDRFLSRQHARVFDEDGRWLIEDLGSRNGTVLNGNQVTHPTELSPGDRLELSGSKIEVLEVDGRRAPEPIEAPEPTAPRASVRTELGADLSQSVCFSALELLRESEQKTAKTLARPEELRAHAARLRVLTELHSRLAGVTDPREILDRALEQVFDLLGPEHAAVLLLDPEDQPYWAAQRSRGDPDEGLFYSETLVEEVLGKGLAVRMADASQDQAFAEAASVLSAGIKTLMAVPLIAEQKALGLISLSSAVHERYYSDEDLDLLNSVAAVLATRLHNLQLTAEVADRRWMEWDMEVARRIQTSLLPDTIPAIEGYTVRAGNDPSLTVSGDFFQVIERPRDVLFFLCDVSGKGAAASLLTAYLEAASAYPIESGSPPDRILSRINDLLEKRSPAESFATAFLGSLDPVTGRLTYASAGHNPALLLRRSGEVERFGRTGLPLGLLAGSDYGSETTALDRGDTLVVYSDGITEAANPSREEFGVERLVETCFRCDRADAMVLRVSEALETFVEGEPYGDDRTILVVHRDP